jgi:hypothetical protein
MKRIIFLSLFISSLTFSQWMPDVRLTYDPAYSTTPIYNLWGIASAGEYLHIVFNDQRDGNEEIYYKHSSDKGLTWGQDIRISYNQSNSFGPSIASEDSTVIIFWYDDRDSNNEIYYRRSSNNGTTWGIETRFTYSNSYSINSSAAISGSNVSVAWEDGRNGHSEIYYKSSFDGGLSWSSDLRLTYNQIHVVSAHPTIARAGSEIVIAWTDNRDNESDEIYFKRSTNSGTTWGSDIRLTNKAFDSYGPSIGLSSPANIHIVWWDDRYMDNDIFYKHSTNGGINWSNDVRLTNDWGDSENPSIAVSGENVHVVWCDDRTVNFEIFYKRSTNSGLSWGPDTRITYDNASSCYPYATVTDTTVHVVWTDNRDGNGEIYYKSNPSGNPVGIQPISSEIPNHFSLFQNYPNPFNPVTKIKFDIPPSKGVRGMIVKLIIFDVLGREIATLVNEKLNPGIYEVTWDASIYPSGVYFYKLVTQDYSETKKMVLVK